MILAHDIRGDGPLLVLIHGLTESRAAWDPIAMTDRFTVLRVDLRGHGESPVASPYDAETLANDVHDTVEAVRPGAVPLVVGHSMGAIVATAYGVLHPVSGVVNIDQPLALGDMQAQVKSVERMLRGIGFRLLMGGMMKRLKGQLPPAELRRLEKTRRARREVVLGMWSPMLDQTPEELEATVQRLTEIPESVPYLVISGHDPGDAYVEWLTAMIPAARLEVWEPVTHYPHLADPARFAARIDRFAGVERSSDGRTGAADLE